MQRALRVADACMDAAVSVELFVEILNRYVYYFDQENDAVSTTRSLIDQTAREQRDADTCLAVQVTTKYLNGLIELIHSNLNTNENTSSLENPRKHFTRTIDYIAGRGYEGVEIKAKQ